MYTIITLIKRIITVQEESLLVETLLVDSWEKLW